MGLTLGDGLAILAVVGLLITLIVTVAQRFKKGGDDESIPNPNFCKEHLSLATGQAEIKATLQGLGDSMDEVKESQVSMHKRLDEFINRFVKI